MNTSNTIILNIEVDASSTLNRSDVQQQYYFKHQSVKCINYVFDYIIDIKKIELSKEIIYDYIIYYYY